MRGLYHCVGSGNLAAIVTASRPSAFSYPAVAVSSITSGTGELSDSLCLTGALGHSNVGVVILGSLSSL